jgi:hypothetical protein
MSGVEGLSCSGSSSCPCPNTLAHWVASGESGVEELLRQRNVLHQSLEDSRVLSLHMARWIVEHHVHRPFEKDWACGRCVPYSDSIVPGFVCVLHVASGLVDAANGQ